MHRHLDLYRVLRQDRYISRRLDLCIDLLAKYFCSYSILNFLKQKYFPKNLCSYQPKKFLRTSVGK